VNTARITTADEKQAIANELCGPAFEEVPDLEGLQRHLKRVVPAALPVNIAAVIRAATLCKTVPEPGGIFKMFKSSLTPIQSFDFPTLSSFLANEWTDVRDGTEDMMHHFMTVLVERPLLLFISWLKALRSAPKVERDSSEKDKRHKSTLDDSRPDWLLISRVLVFRGEEKRSGLGNLAKAARELLDKFETWSPVLFGDAPYVLAYAAAGFEFQLYAIHKPVDAWKPVLVKLGDELNLEDPEDYYKLFSYVINLVRVVEAIVKALPDDINMGIGAYRRPGSGAYSNIDFHHDFVRKELKDGERVAYDEAVLRAVYQHVRDGRIVKTVRCLDGYPARVAGTDNIVLHLEPVGLQRLPRRAAELLQALRDVFEALASMHACGFAHRDVRWPNVIVLPDKTWRLIDLDFAAKLVRGQALWPTWSQGVPTRPRADAPWTDAQDVAQAVALLDDTDMRWLDVDRRAQMRSALAACSTAAEAGTTLWRADVVAMFSDA